VLHYAGRSRQRMAMLDRLEKDHADRLTSHILNEGRRMNLPSLLSQVDSCTRIYACGPTRMIDELESMSDNWPDGVLHFEHFSAHGSALDPSKEHSFVVHLKDSDVDVTVPADKTLLQALQSAGFDVPCDCGEGLCGTCEVGVVEGDVDHRDKVLTKAERAENKRMLTCCSRAVGQKIILAL